MILHPFQRRADGSEFLSAAISARTEDRAGDQPCDSSLLQRDDTKAISLTEYLKYTEGIPFRVMTGTFSAGVDARLSQGKHLYRRVTCGISDDGTEVTVKDPVTHEERRMLTFASNSYFGLGKDPEILHAISDALAIYGTGPAGSPMLNGTTELHVQLEERIAKWLGKEAAMLFSSGYLANAWPAALVRPGDLFVWDERLHASLREGGMKAIETKRGIQNRDEKVLMHAFHHNDVRQLGNILRRFRKSTGYPPKDIDETPPRESIWIAVEGVYSMDGDLVPLPKIAKLAEQYGAFVVVDDAHGEGVLGRGRGIEHHFSEPSPTFLTVGTLGKATASGGGGFIAGPRDVIQFLKPYTPSYVYSTSLSTANAAAALAAFDIIEREPWRVTTLHNNVQYFIDGLREIGVEVADRDSGIIGITVPERTDLRELALQIHNRGVLVNTVEEPVVPRKDQHMRINFIATHTRPQLDRFLSILREFRAELVWNL